MPKPIEADPEFRQLIFIGFLYPDSLWVTLSIEMEALGVRRCSIHLCCYITRPLIRLPDTKIRVVYSGDARDVLVRLTSGTTEIHPLIQKLYPPKPMEFDVPHEVTSTGAVTSS